MWITLSVEKRLYLHTYTRTYLITYSMEQSPSWEANMFPASQDIPRILCNPKVHYCILKFPPPVRIPSQLNPVRKSNPSSWRHI
jgi:hypothetical protein